MIRADFSSSQTAAQRRDQSAQRRAQHRSVVSMATFLLSAAVAGTCAANTFAEIAQGPNISCAHESVSEDSSVRMRESCTLSVDQASVSLGDVAHLEGPLAQALSDLILIDLTTQLAPRRVTIDQVRDAARKSGANMGLLSISGRACEIRTLPSAPDPAQESPESIQKDRDPYAGMRPATEYAGDTTLQSVIAQYVTNMHAGNESARVFVRFDERDAKVLTLSQYEFDFEISTAATSASPRLPLQITVYEGVRVVRTLRVIVDIALEQPVILTSRSMARGQEFDTDHLVREVRLIDPHPAQAINSLDALMGLASRGRLLRGEIVRQDDVIAKVTIERGEEITLRARTGSFVIRMRGQALEDGRIGEMMRVRRLSDREEYVGRLEADREVNITPEPEEAMP